MLHLHRAERADRLADALAEVLRVPLQDPFCREVVAVPAKGVERWLSQRLSSVLGAGRDGDDGAGVTANLAFPSPARLVAEAVSAVAGVEPDDDAWAPGRVLWRLLEVVDACTGEPWCGVLAAHLGGDDEGSHRRGRRWATAAALADLFAGYGAERPQMLVDWAQGRDTDGAGGALPGDLGWQAELWRRLRHELGAPSPAERLDETCARLRDDVAAVDLPERLSLFGPTRLTREQLTVLQALGVRRDVHLWVPHPSPAMWQRLAQHAPPVRRRDDRSGLLLASPLLAALARDTRELQHRLLPLVASDVRCAGDRPAPTTLLEHLQAGVRDDRAPSPVAQLDGTVQVHACHGPGRQVEVLREALLHAFEDDPTLEPRDVLVLCPDVETWAPLVRAAFGQGAAAGPDGHPGHGLRVRLADRSLRQTNPLLDTVSGLLDLADGRVTASQVLDLAATAPVRRRFGLHDDDVEQLRTWAGRAGVRWGIGSQQRAAHDLAGVRQGTWTTGLDRVLVGVTADETDLLWLDTALPLDDVDSTDVDLAGRLAELVDRLWAVLARLQGPQPAQQWVEQLARGLDLLTDVREDDAWQRAQASRELASAVEHAGTSPLRLADVRAMLADRLAGRPTRANFRTGELTVCTMVPMRSVPHRVVALLGLDDDAFPRGAGVDGDDVLARDPCVGERDRRSEDRQLLLDAVMSAGDRLVVLYTGADPVTGAERPPAVPLGELLDALARTVGADDARALVRRHPLQPFDPRALDAAAPFSFDRLALRAARAASGDRRPEPRLLEAPLPPAAAGDVDLADLVAFVQHPVQAFLRQRLGVRVPDEHDDVLDALATDLAGLARWDVGERMLHARLAGVEAPAFVQAELRRGTLPPGRLGLAVLDDLQQGVGALVDACLPLHEAPSRAVDVDLDLGDGRRLAGTVTGLRDDAGSGEVVLASSSYSTLAPKHRLSAWVRLLAAAAADPSRRHRALTTGRGPYRRPAWRSTLVAPEQPLEVLRQLVDLRDRGLRAPLPVAPLASAAYAERRLAGAEVADAVSAAQGAWGDRYGDGTDRHLRYALGADAPFEALLAEVPARDERWTPDPSRFGVLAVRLWTPLLDLETVGRPQQVAP